MFTGIIEAVGRVVADDRGRLGISAPSISSRLSVGGSIAVNGCCLTVTAFEGEAMFADMVPETLRRTTLGSLRLGDAVNLELPSTPSTALDGHLVQGHVDATAGVLRRDEVGLGAEVTFELPSELAGYVAQKGSIAVDGISLTVAAVDDSARSFTVALIPHTLASTVAGAYEPGSTVNLEVDVLARYTERLLKQALKGFPTGPAL